MILERGDCLELLKNIPDNSINLVLIDPPYGTMGGEKRVGRKRDRNRIDDCVQWDIAINENILLTETKRILKPNGKAVVFSQEPYTSKLILCNIPALTFVQRLAWKKNTAGNFLCASQNCMQYIEDMVVFRKDYSVYDEEKKNPLRKYFLDELAKTGLTVPEINKLIGTKSMANHYFTNGIQFAMPSKKHYEKLQATGHFERPYDEIKKEFNEFQAVLLETKNKKFPSVFNLNGKRSKSNVFEYAKDNNGFHPTQKPVALLEDLVLTYTNEGDTVIDFVMGSGSTGVACKNTNRNFIGFELDNDYFEIAKKRILETG